MRPDFLTKTGLVVTVTVSEENNATKLFGGPVRARCMSTLPWRPSSCFCSIPGLRRTLLLRCSSGSRPGYGGRWPFFFNRIGWLYSGKTLALDNIIEDGPKTFKIRTKQLEGTARPGALHSSRSRWKPWDTLDLVQFILDLLHFIVRSLYNTGLHKSTSLLCSEPQPRHQATPVGAGGSGGAAGAVGRSTG